MNQSQTARLNALRRIRVFMTDHAGDLGTITKATSWTDLDQAVTALEQYSAAQTEAEQDAVARTTMKKAGRDDLRLHHMAPIAAIARKKLNKTPAIQYLKLPAKNTSDATLASAGSAMGNSAETYARVFIDEQLPADFIAQLQAAVQAVLEAVDQRTSAVTKLVAATSAVKNQLAVTHTDVKVVSTLVVKQLKGNTKLLDAWKQTKRIRLKPVASTATVPTPVVTPAPASTNTPAAPEVPQPRAA